MTYRGFEVALIVPCYNEEAAIADVITGFRKAMPEMQIYIFDNNSTDSTVDVARKGGANVIQVPLRGKGNVVRRMFSDVESDLYVMVDGDATYDPKSIKAMIDKLIDENLDMVVGCRESPQEIADSAYRRGHQWGNRLLTNAVVKIFGGRN